MSTTVKNIIAILLFAVILLILAGIIFYPYIVGNKQFGDLNQSYDYAIIQRYDGEQKIEIKSWRDYEGEQLQIIDVNGNIYLVSSFNTILIKEGK